MSTFVEKVEKILEPYRESILNPEGLILRRNRTIEFKQELLCNYESLTNLFFTHSPHLLLAAEVNEKFHYFIKPYTKLAPTNLIQDVVVFAKKLELSESLQFRYTKLQCKKLLDLIQSDFEVLEKEVIHEEAHFDLETIQVTEIDSEFLLLDDPDYIKRIFNGIQLG